MVVLKVTETGGIDTVDHRKSALADSIYHCGTVDKTTNGRDRRATPPCGGGGGVEQEKAKVAPRYPSSLFIPPALHSESA